MDIPFNPIQRSQRAESLVMNRGGRLYHRFRPAPYYGGIATADAVGCSFLCAYCWNYFRNLDPARFKRYYSSQQVASRLLEIAQSKSFHLFRITGSEPILGEASLDHLADTLKIIFQTRPHSIFILETNGLFLGYSPDFIKKLRFQNLWIRVSLKGTDEESFQRITGAQGNFFRYPLKALKELQEHRLKTWPAIMGDLFSDEEIARFRKFLEEYGIEGELDQEILEGYPFVLDNMRRRMVNRKRL